MTLDQIEDVMEKEMFVIEPHSLMNHLGMPFVDEITAEIDQEVKAILTPEKMKQITLLALKRVNAKRKFADGYNEKV